MTLAAYVSKDGLRSKIQVTADSVEDVGKEVNSSIVSGIASLYNHSGNQSGGFSENWTWYYRRIQQYHSWAYIYPEDVLTGKKNTCSTMFIAALFIIARTWKEPRCPSTEEWIQKMWYIYTMEYYSAIKNNEFMKFLGKWLDLEGIILSEVTQKNSNDMLIRFLCLSLPSGNLWS